LSGSVFRTAWNFFNARLPFGDISDLVAGDTKAAGMTTTGIGDWIANRVAEL